jgi:hypothetical protein
MIRKLLCCASLGGLLLAGVPAIAQNPPSRQTPPPSQSQQPGTAPDQQATKSVSGRVTAIGDQGKSFAVEVENGGSKATMQFVVDKNTQVQGVVKTGTLVTVQYQPSGGQNLCVSVAAQQG